MSRFIATAFAQGREYISYTDAKPIFDTLRSDLLPPAFRDKTASERQAMWPEWIARRDAAIRARVAPGDEIQWSTFCCTGRRSPNGRVPQTGRSAIL